MNPKGNPAFKKGVSFHPEGRPKGSQNKFTTLKQAFVNAFQRIGGEEALYEFVTPEPIKIKNKKGKVIRTIELSPARRLEFFKLLSKMLPAEVEVKGTAQETKIVIVYPEGYKQKNERPSLTQTISS